MAGCEGTAGSGGGGVLMEFPLLGRVCGGGIGLALLGTVWSLDDTGGGSHGSWATLRPESFFCHSCWYKWSVNANHHKMKMEAEQPRTG